MAFKEKFFKLNKRKQLNIPILLICFDRPQILKKTIKLLLSYGVTNLYCAQDGYDGDNKQILKNHSQVKLILEELKLNKNLTIKINLLKKNFGKRFGPPKAINWFFKNVNMGAIIEDDILPSKSFFIMSEILLKEHKNDKKVFQICEVGLKTLHSWTLLIVFKDVPA